MKKHLHTYFTLLLLVSFSYQSVSKTIIYFSFKYNQKTLATTVCVNKDKPKSCCEAKCYLDKEIKKEEKRQSESSATIKDKVEKTELKTGLCNFVFLGNTDVQNVTCNYLTKPLMLFSSSVFHPPTKMLCNKR